MPNLPPIAPAPDPWSPRHPLQAAYAAAAPCPVGVVFIAWPGMSEDDLRGHYRAMSQAGFRNLKQVMPSREWPKERLLAVAAEEGLWPQWYAETAAADPALGPDDPAASPARRAQLAARASQGRAPEYEPGRTPADPELPDWAAGGAPDYEPGPDLPEIAHKCFVVWLRQQYGAIEGLRTAWNQDQPGICRAPYESWDDLAADIGCRRQRGHDYRFYRDVFRFKADVYLERLRWRLRRGREQDPSEPQRAGGEMGLFLPFAWRGIDMAGIAEVMAEYGSFYPSMHLAWHYEEAGFEVAGPAYLQASLAADWAKGTWVGIWESTGGPQQMSGGKGWDRPGIEDFPSFTVDEGVIAQLLLSYLAAGARGAGLWCWNARQAGLEGGEYALCNRLGEATARARAAGAIARAAHRWREELWAARKQPLVGLLVTWDNDALWAAASVRNRDHWRHYPIQARLGAGRALLEGNVPFEHLTDRDLRRGAADRYPVLFLPAHLALSPETLETLHGYAERGGRVVLDAPGGWYDDFGRLLPTRSGSPFERLFGVEVTDFQFARNTVWELAGRPLDGFTLELRPTTARVTRRFSNGQPAVTEHALGRGSAAVLAWDASFALRRPGRPELSALLRETLLDGRAPPFRADGVLAYRLAAPAADHYFLVNDGPAREVRLSPAPGGAPAALDPVHGETLPLDRPVPLAAHSARWLRLAHASPA